MQLVAVDQWARAQPPWLLETRRYSKEERDYFLRRVAVMMKVLGETHGLELEPLLDAHGWFRISAFGFEGDKAGGLIALHADRRPALQKRVLAELERLHPLGETAPSNFAYLWDRVAVNDKRGQRYGTQGRLAGGVWTPYRLEEPAAEVDARRAAVGLEPLARHAARYAHANHLSF